ncbi:MAG: transposase [Methanosphaera sp.]|nr:transposase [Methanosphaera sp.]
MLCDDVVYLTKSILVRGLSKKQYDVLVDISLKLNNLRNCAVETTYLIKKSDDKHYKKINYKSIISDVKSEFNEYSLVQTHLANAAIKKHVDSFNGYVTLLNKKIDNEFNRDVHSPKKHYNRLHNIIIPKESITSSKKKLREGYIELPLSRQYKKELVDVNVRPRIKIPEDIRDKKIIQVEIIPIDNGRMFKANFTYQAEKEPLGLDKDNVMGIDLGVNNFATVVTTEETPFIVDGKFLKNQIAFKCKKVAHYQSILNKTGLKKSRRIKKINTKFKQIQNNYLNHVTKTIINACKDQDIGTIILGYNKNFQYKSNIGKKQNQIFTHIAFKKFKEKLENKCKIHDLTLIIQEESYTSKSSFLDNDILPVYDSNNGQEKEYEFKGKRIKRGLYKTFGGKLLNADVNAAANIIRKSKQKFNFERLYKWVQYAPSKIKPL